MKQSLQIKLSQHLTLTPQLQQSIRLLQLSTLELSQEIDQLLQENPLLEIPDSSESGSDEPDQAAENEASQPDDEGFDNEPWGDDHRSHDSDEEDNDFNQPAASGSSLVEHLFSQLSLMNLSDRDQQFVALLIENLNDEGYLEASLDDISQNLPSELEVDPIELSTALKHLQHMDPPGVGARNLSECLCLQIASLPSETANLDLAMTLAANHLNLLAAHDWAKLRKVLHCDDSALKDAQHIIMGLNPKPGSVFLQNDTRYIIPDVIIRQVRGQWRAALNQAAIPRVRINRLYADLISHNREANHAQFTNQLQEARWFIKNIQQRFETILKVSQAIVDHQKNFFEHGEIGMCPLVLREIAQEVNLHESTVSRVTTQKYMLTPRGIFELKYFFGSHVPTDAGGACSSTAIRALIKQFINSETPKKPLSDGKIAEMLAQQGVIVARRTIAKYREALGIPPVSLRKTI